MLGRWLFLITRGLCSARKRALFHHVLPPPFLLSSPPSSSLLLSLLPLLPSPPAVKRLLLPSLISPPLSVSHIFASFLFCSLLFSSTVFSFLLLSSSVSFCLVLCLLLSSSGVFTQAAEDAHLAHRRRHDSMRIGLEQGDERLRLVVGHDGKTVHERLNGGRAPVVGLEFGEAVHWRSMPACGPLGKLESIWADGVFLGVRGNSGEVIVGCWTRGGW